VTPDGRITFPLIGNIMAQGKTVTELKEIITEKLKNFIEPRESPCGAGQSVKRKGTRNGVSTWAGRIQQSC
jgi:hypothetical protein